ncbi:MAG: tRNA 2-thiouridine(34) synthase MnmA [Planctomycetota bacterium]|nr:MAG: tRNA 2-thiouridine(34) synthase MnmA [Planctomycetota bacterium]
MSSPRVLAALSGGVDSSVAALLLQRQGYEVVGAFLRNGVAAPAGRAAARQGCCSETDARDAALVADRLGIPFHSIDMVEEFERIQADFVAAYAAGRTPNPCARCNQTIKFGALGRIAEAVGARWLATGHYARLERRGGRTLLRRGADPVKDQSYVLFAVGEELLGRTLLPVGALSKDQTRALAEEAGLRTAGKPDSQEICFVPTGDYRDVLRNRGGLGRAGRILDLDGRELGRHEGYMGFTRGQRRGLGISAGRPLYVLDIRPETGDVIVGPIEAAGCTEAVVGEFRTYGCDLGPGEAWEEVEIQYRSTPGGVAGRAERLPDGRVRVEFAAPAPSVNPGQGLAVYRGDRLLGGGWIERAVNPNVVLPV